MIRLLAILLLYVPLSLSAQDEKLRARITFTDTALVKTKTTFKDQRALDNYLSDLILSLNREGRLEASLDSFKVDSLHHEYYIHAGPEYTWAHLKRGNVEAHFLQKAGFKPSHYDQQKFDANGFASFRRKLIAAYENEGFPFAALKLDNLEQEGTTLSAILHIEKNKLVTIDSIRIRGNSKISETYVFNYIGIKPGDIYDESTISKIDSRLKEISFIQLTRPTEVIFTPSYTKVFIYAEKKKANQFDGLLGFLPDEEGKILITGQAHINLTNALNNGDNIELNWKKLQPLTQDFFARLNYPFLFRTPLGTEGQLHIYKRDTTYLDVRRYISIQYFLKRGNTFKVFAQNKTTSLLSVRGLEFATSLPEFADVTNVLYGAGFKTMNFDYRYNPRKGYGFMIEGGAGSRNIRQNNKINPEAYKNVVMKSSQYQVTTSTEVFIPLFKRSTFRIAASGARIQSQAYFSNELFRLGGLRSLRGFDEESIFASTYGIVSGEFRLLIDRNSYVQLFFDQAMYEDLAKKISDTPYGFGTGISFETKAGIFSLSYALGKQFDNPLYLRAAKVHFGIVNYF